MRTEHPVTRHESAYPSLPKDPAKRRRAGIVATAVVLLGLATACTPEEVSFFVAITEPYAEVLTDEQLATLRYCESTDNYQAVDRTGSFRGAYQFTQSTWDGVARRHFGWLEGVDPAEAEPWWQDAMTRALFSERGRQPWPVCGRRL